MLLLVLAGAYVPTTEAFADPNCRCRADGKYYQLGDIACIGGAKNRRLAQCVMVLNNTSWTVLAKECPQVHLEMRHEPQSIRSGSINTGAISSGRRISSSNAARGS